MGSGGKGGGGPVTVGYNYFADFAGLAGIGPADELVELVIDGKSVWTPESPVLRISSANPYQFTVENRGDVYFYWGTEDQNLSDPVLTKGARDHPPYRGRVLLVFRKFFCGFERLSVPDIRMVYRRAADQQIITGAVAGIDEEGQCNPLAALAGVSGFES